MRNPFAPGIGGVLSADIAVPEHERELRFYSQILTTGSAPLWRDDLMNNRGTPVIGLGARSSEYEVLPLQWMPHSQVSDVGASAERSAPTLEVRRHRRLGLEQRCKPRAITARGIVVAPGCADHRWNITVHPGFSSKLRPRSTFDSTGGRRNASPSGWTAPIPCGIL